MGFVIVLAIAVAVGVMVFRLTGGGDVLGNRGEAPEWAGGEVEDRGSEAPWATDAPTPASATAPARIQVSAETQIPVVAAKRSWHSRLSGALGLVVAIGVGAVAIAFTLYGLGSLLARLIESGNR